MLCVCAILGLCAITKQSTPMHEFWFWTQAVV